MTLLIMCLLSLSSSLPSTFSFPSHMSLCLLFLCIFLSNSHCYPQALFTLLKYIEIYLCEHKDANCFLSLLSVDNTSSMRGRLLTEVRNDLVLKMKPKRHNTQLESVRLGLIKQPYTMLKCHIFQVEAKTNNLLHYAPNMNKDILYQRFAFLF